MPTTLAYPPPPGSGPARAGGRGNDGVLALQRAARRPGGPAGGAALRRWPRAAAIRADLGLDQPLPQRLLSYLNDAVAAGRAPARLGRSARRYGGSDCCRWAAQRALVLKWPYLRRSFQSNKDVLSTLARSAFRARCGWRWRPCCWPAVGGMALGVVAALRPQSWLDRVLVTASVLGISVPSFVAGYS
ncbi:MAG: hypothetical protein WKG07_44625 [Hymenobacter sp.]